MVDSRWGDFFFFFEDVVDIQVRAGRGRCIVDNPRDSKEKLRAGKKSYANRRSHYGCGALLSAAAGSVGAGASTTLPFSEMDFSNDCLVSLLWRKERPT